MAVTVAGKNYVQISTCDTSTAGGTWLILTTQDVDAKKEGTASLCGIVKTAGNNTVTFTPTAAVDLSGTKHVRFWFISTHGGLLNTYALDGLNFWASDGTNTGYWKILGKDTYPGGWINCVIDVSKACDSGTKPTNMNAITTMGYRINLTAAGKNAVNTWTDNLCVCDGLIAYGDDGGGYFDLDDINTAEETPVGGGWGIIRKIGGQYFSTGSLDIGFATSATKFNAKSQVLVFENRRVNDTLYAINLIDSANASFTTEFILGSKSGTAGIEGCMFRVQDAAQTMKYAINGGTDTDIDNFKLYGSTFYDAGATLLPLNKTGIASVHRARSSNVATLGCNAHGLIVGNSITVAGISGTGYNGTATVASVVDANHFTYANTGDNESETADTGGTITSTNTEVLNCSWETSDEVTIQTCTVTNCSFVAANDEAVVVPSNNTHQMTSCNFMSNPNAVRMLTAGTNYVFTNLNFVNNTVDVDNDSGGQITISSVGATNPASQSKVTGSTTINVSYPVYIKTVDVNNNAVYQAQVAIYKTNDNSEIVNTDTDNNGEVSTSYSGTAEIYVRIRKSSTGATKYFPIDASGSITTSGYNAKFILYEDTIAEATTNATIDGDFAVNTSLKSITHTTDAVIYTTKELYTWLMDYFDESGFMDDTTPMSAQTPTEYTLINGWFMDDTSMQFLQGGAIQTTEWTHPTNTTGIRILTLDAAANLSSGDIGAAVTDGVDTGKLLAYDTTLKKLWIRCDGADDLFDDDNNPVTVGGQACGNMTAISVSGENIWSNTFTLGTIVDGTTLDVYQGNDTQVTPWWSTGHIDILVKVTEAGDEINNGGVTVLARKYGTLYDHSEVDASTGKNPVPLSTYLDTNNETAEGTVGALPYTNITFDFGATSHDVDGNAVTEPYDVEIDCAGLTVAQTYEYLKYVTRHDSGTTLNGVNGEYYVAVGDIRFDYYNEGGGGTAFDELNQELITGTGGDSPTGYLVSLIDNGATGTMVLRNVHGTFTADQVITGGTTGRTAQVNGTPELIAPSKQAPFGTFAGGKFFGARGVYITNMNVNDSNNYELVDSTNAPKAPPSQIPIIVTEIESGDTVSIFITTGNNEIINRSVFNIDATQPQPPDVAEIRVEEAIPADTPTSGTIRVVRRDSSNNILGEDRLSYSSWNNTGQTAYSTFVLSSVTQTAYDTDDTAYVPYIDITATTDTAQVSVTYVTDRYTLTRVRKQGIIPFNIKKPLNSSGLEVTAIRTEDIIVGP